MYKVEVHRRQGTWMVTRREPLMVPGGWLRMAKWVGPPPRPTVPPRPWNRVSFTLYFSATAASFSYMADAHTHIHQQQQQRILKPFGIRSLHFTTVFVGRVALVCT